MTEHLVPSPEQRALARALAASIIQLRELETAAQVAGREPLAEGANKLRRSCEAHLAIMRPLPRFTGRPRL